MVTLYRRPHSETEPGQPAQDGNGRQAPGENPQTGSTAGLLRIEDVVNGRQVTAEFQPIIRLDTGDVVGYEAFARGPAGSQFERPEPMFQAAEAVGLARELDTVAHGAAFSAALAAKLNPTTALFINVVHPGTDRAVPDDLAVILAQAQTRLRVFIEMSERSMAADAQTTLVGIERFRRAGWGIALDNVGVSASSLALLPFARPDVVKIDVSLVHETAHPHAARVMTSVTAHAQRTGASIMAVGIETEAHLRTARGLGAEFGQGFHFGRPGPLPAKPRPLAHPIGMIQPGPVPAIDATPFTLAAKHGPAVHAADSVIALLAGHLERRASLDPDPVVILKCLPDNEMISGAPLALMQMLARNASYIGALVGELPLQPIPDVNLARLADDDPLRAEASVVLIGPHYAALLAVGWLNGIHSYRLVYDRDVVEQAAYVLLRKIIR